jgi:hypothetical protein
VKRRIAKIRRHNAEKVETIKKRRYAMRRVDELKQNETTSDETRRGKER